MGEYLHTFKPFKYIHIPKTAGSAINQSALIERQHSDRRECGHVRACDIENIEDFYTFALIRNPYDKVYSSWNYYKKSIHHTLPQVIDIRQNWKSFEEFVLDYSNSKKCDHHHFERTQKEYITNSRGEVLIDYVGNYYDINSEWKIVQSNNPIFQNIIVPLQVINRTDSGLYHKTDNGEFNSSWLTKYTEEMADIIYEHWKDDFDYFNIDKNTWK